VLLPFPEDRAAWVEVLETMYEMERRRERPVPTEGEPDGVFGASLRTDRIVGESGLDPESVRNGVDVLYELGFATGDAAAADGDGIGLTRDGVEMAHRNTIERRQRRTNQHLLGILLLLLLALAAVFVL